MRVLVVSKYFKPHEGGIETVAFGLAERLASWKHSVVVSTSNVPKSAHREHMCGFAVHRNDCAANIFNTVLCPGIFDDLMFLNYDIVHIHLPDPFGSIFVLAANIFRKKPYVVTYHADIVRGRWYHRLFMAAYSPLLNMVLDRAKTIIATTKGYAETSDFLKSRMDKVKVVPNFVDVEKYTPGGKEIEGLVVMFVGRLVPYKGVDYLIKAFNLLEGDGALLIVGDGPERKKLEELAKDDKRICFVGRVEDLLYWYRQCDFLVLPSVTRQEAFGIVLLEAMACGKPVIASDLGGMPEVVDKYGLTVRPRRPLDLYDSMGKMIKILRSGKSFEGMQEYVVGRYSLDVVAAEVEEVLENACSVGNTKRHLSSV